MKSMNSKGSSRDKLLKGQFEVFSLASFFARVRRPLTKQLPLFNAITINLLTLGYVFFLSGDWDST